MNGLPPTLNKVIESEKLMEDLPDNEKGLLHDIFNSYQTPQIQKLTKLIKNRYKKDMVSISPAEICKKTTSFFSNSSSVAFTLLE